MSSFVKPYNYFRKWRKLVPLVLVSIHELAPRFQKFAELWVKLWYHLATIFAQTAHCCPLQVKI